MTLLHSLPSWCVECSTILLSRFACGDGTTLDLGDRYLTEDVRETVAERHSHQVASMLETRSELD